MISSVDDELRVLESASEDDLWRHLGEAVLAGPEGERYEHRLAGLGARQTRSERAVAAAHAWLDEHRAELRQRVCGNEAIRRTFSSDPGATVEIGKAVADAILGLAGVVPIVTISALIARRGVDWLCQEPA
jgi:hypothetical protein